MRAVAALVLAAAITACAAPAAPSPVPTDMTGVLAALVLRGAAIHRVVAGDSGCPGGQLHSNAVRVELTLAGDDTPYEVHLFRWRRPAQFAEAAQPFEECIDEFVTGVEGDVPIDALAVEPWRAYGAGWSEELLETLEAALRDAAAG